MRCQSLFSGKKKNNISQLNLPIELNLKLSSFTINNYFGLVTCKLKFMFLKLFHHYQHGLHSFRSGGLFFQLKRTYMYICFLFLHKKIYFGYSVEVPHRGTPNEYPQHMFSWRYKKNILWLPPHIGYSLLCHLFKTSRAHIKMHYTFELCFR